MKKLVFAMMAVFAMVSCGGGIAEKTAAIEEEMNEKLKAAFEDKDSEAAQGGGPGLSWQCVFENKL